eukprot:276104-Prorocentrum_minimum.AAC.4
MARRFRMKGMMRLLLSTKATELKGLGKGNHWPHFKDEDENASDASDAFMQNVRSAEDSHSSALYHNERCHNVTGASLIAHIDSDSTYKTM